MSQSNAPGQYRRLSRESGLRDLCPLCIKAFMPRRSSHPFDALAERFAQIIAERVSAALPAAGARGARNGVSKLRGLKRDTRCRYPGCKNRSKGPRFRFFCDEHLKLPKKKQDEALAKWSQKND